MNMIRKALIEGLGGSVVRRAAPAAMESVFQQSAAPAASSQLPRRERLSAERHPIYGTLLHDFGFKRTWLTEVSVIADRDALPFWERNRAHRMGRSREMADDIERSARRSGSVLGFPGVISAFEMDSERAATWTRGIVDGQHRCGALQILLRENKLAPDSHVLVDVHPCSDASAVAELFVQINKAEPVQALDLPRSAASEKEKQLVTSAAETLASRFRTMFKVSQRCRVPHLNVDNVRNALFESGVLRRHATLDSDVALVEWAMERNAELAKRQKKTWLSKLPRGQKTAAFESALEKARVNGFFLGLTNEWLEQ